MITIKGQSFAHPACKLCSDFNHCFLYLCQTVANICSDHLSPNGEMIWYHSCFEINDSSLLMIQRIKLINFCSSLIASHLLQITIICTAVGICTITAVSWSAAQTIREFQYTGALASNPNYGSTAFAYEFGSAIYVGWIAGVSFTYLSTFFDFRSHDHHCCVLVCCGSNQGV